MVEAVVLGGVFDGHDIFGIFHNAEDGFVAAVACADGADLVVGYIMAMGAEADVEAQLVEGVCKAEGIFFAFFYEVEYEAQGCFLTNAG